MGHVFSEEELDKIDAWHGGAAPGVPLHDYLGKTWDEWRALMGPHRITHYAEIGANNRDDTEADPADGGRPQEGDVGGTGPA